MTYGKRSFIHESQIIFFSGVFSFCNHYRVANSSFGCCLFSNKIIPWKKICLSIYAAIKVVLILPVYTSAYHREYPFLPIIPFAASSISSVLYRSWTPPLGYLAKCPFPLPPASTFKISRLLRMTSIWTELIYIEVIRLKIPTYLCFNDKVTSS